MRRRSFMALSGACLVCGCSGAVHQLPQLTPGNLALARAEMQDGGPVGRRRTLTDEQAVTVLRYAAQRIRAPAEQLCREMNVGVCQWDIRGSRDRSLDASALPNGRIVINYGVAEYAANGPEICMVIAHEMGHQAANHLVTLQRNHAVGAAIGSILLGAAAAAASSGSYGSGEMTRSAMEAGANVGGAIGQLSYSKEQEREADYIAALILYRAGVDLDMARGLLVTLARMSGQTDTRMLDTHPAGPERLAGWDRAVAEIRASGGRLPPRA